MPKGNTNQRWNLPCGPTSSADDLLEGFDIGSVLFGKDSLGEAGGGVVWEDGAGSLDKDSSFIIVFGNQMHRRAGLRFSGRQNGFMNSNAIHPLASKLRKQRGMNIQNTLWKCSKNFYRQEPKITREAQRIASLKGR